MIRPGDANETTVAWRLALQRSDGPVALLFSRQNVAVIDRSDGVTAAEETEQGGYVLWESQTDREPDLILIATGAEVPPTLAAGRQLAAERVRTRVVSMPCVELFEAQADSYRQQVIPTTVGARLAIEPGATQGWWKWVGDHGDVFGLDRFGASAPGTRSSRSSGSPPTGSRPERGTCSSAPRTARRWRGRQSRRCSGSPLSGRAYGWIFSRVTPFRGGHLQQLIDERAVVGATSNPTIFRKAMTEGDAYDEQLLELNRHATGQPDPAAKDVFWAMASQDIQDACDLFAPVWDGGHGRDGYVSLEVDPSLAYDSLRTYREAAHLHDLIDRPNLLVKIPATKPGLAAIEDAIAHGISINVTLIFSLERYAEVAESYVRGLERLVAEGEDPSPVASVASSSSPESTSKPTDG